MVSLEGTLKMTVEHLLQFFPIYRGDLRDIEICRFNMQITQRCTTSDVTLRNEF